MRVSVREWVMAGLASLSCAVLVWLSIVYLDRPIATWSYTAIHRPDWARWLTHLAVLPDPLAIVALAVVAALYIRQGGLSFATRTALAAALATILATMAVIMLKYVFGRLWPETWVDHNPSWITNHAFGFNFFHGGRGYESFPSGHTTRITAPFAVAWARLPRWRVLWVLPTLLVVVGLLACNFHFLSDCIAGAYLGAASAAVILALI